MRHGLALAALLLPLAGCVVPPDGGRGYYSGQPGYSYDSGSPAMVVAGVNQPLVYYGGSWGYHDSYRRFHRAPDHVYRNLETRYPGGVGYRGHGGGPYGGGAHAAPRYNQAPHYSAASAYVGPRHYGGYQRPAAGAPGGVYHQQGQRAAAPHHGAPQHVAPHQNAQRPQHSNQNSGQHRRRDGDRR